LSEFISIEWMGCSFSSVSISCCTPIDTTVANTDWCGDKLAGGRVARNKAKTLRAAFFFTW
jgi:hypothetical protein